MYDKYFDTVYSGSNVLDIENYKNTADVFEALYKNVLPRDKNATILDIGCGAGHFLYFLKLKGFRNYYGIDISMQQIEFCKKNISNKVKKVDAFVFLNTIQCQYDLIVAHDVLEHIPKRKTVELLQLIHNSLTENGQFILRVPNMSNPFSIDSRHRDFTHELGFTEKSLIQVLSVSGFSKQKVFSTKTKAKTFKNKVRYLMVTALHAMIRFLFYIQDYSVPNYLGKNLIAICRK